MRPKHTKKQHARAVSVACLLLWEQSSAASIALESAPSISTYRNRMRQAYLFDRDREREREREAGQVRHEDRSRTLAEPSHRIGGAVT